MNAPRQSSLRSTRQKREGIVMLLVMMMLLMATGTAMFAIQATQYEQRASTSLGEANWARGAAECTTMAALAYVEDTIGNSGAPPSLGTFWQDTGVLSNGSRKYAIPTPVNPATASAATQNGDMSASMSLEVAPFASNAPRGLAAFLPGQRTTVVPPAPELGYPVAQRIDIPDGAPPAGTGGLRQLRSHWLQETFRLNPITSTNGVRQPTRTRTVVTGFAEIHVVGDSLDSSGVRELHELDAVSRGYIDRIDP